MMRKNILITLAVVSALQVSFFSDFGKAVLTSKHVRKRLFAKNIAPQDSIHSEIIAVDTKQSNENNYSINFETDLIYEPWTLNASKDKFNIVFAKIEKCSSSTVGGVVRNIANRRGFAGAKSFGLNEKEPFVAASHRAHNNWAKKLGLFSLETFKLSWLRSPLARCYSAYYFFKIGRTSKQDREETRLKYLQTSCIDFSFQRLRTNYSTTQPLLERLAAYNFIGITERMDESMVVLQKLLHLDLIDIVHLNAKTPGEKDERGKVIQVHLRPEDETSARIINLTTSSKFRILMSNENKAYKIANRQLDLLVDSIPDFENHLQKYKTAMACAERECTPKLMEGECECLFRDNGCCENCIVDACHDVLATL